MSAIAHDDLIEIEASLIQLGRSSAHFQFRTFKGAALAAKGSVVVACVDRDTQQAIAIPDEVRVKLVTILRISGEDGA
jgi:acyl-CoA thioesterase FadM